MALPTGQISLSQVNTELGLTSTTTISLNQSNVRGLAGVPSGQISMSNLQGKSNAFPFTISTNQTNANLRTLATAAGWNGTSQIAATINSGVIISSNSTSTAALTVDGPMPNGAVITNNGIIVGMGGAGGGAFVGYGPGYPGNPGGNAIFVSVPLAMTNNGTIAGGGGGGGGAPAQYIYDPKGPQGYVTVGGGGGRSSYVANSAGGTAYNPGYAGTYSAAGPQRNNGPIYGGAGGNWGAAGAGGVSTPPAPWGLTTTGGAGGNAVSGNSFVTWNATGTRYGGLV